MATKRVAVTGGVKIILSLLGVFLLFSVGMAQEKKLDNQKDKESYSMGYQFGQNMKSQGTEVNMDVYLAAIRDGLAGKDPVVSREEIRSILGELQQKAVVAHQKELKDLAEKNLPGSVAFMEENKKKDGVKTLPSGLQYKILVEGTGKTPKKTDTVTVQYRVTIVGGKESDTFDTGGKPQTMQVDKVIPGWTEALQLMKEGSKWQLFVPPNLAYGESGMGPVPPNTVLIFDVELISISG